MAERERLTSAVLGAFLLVLVNAGSAWGQPAWDLDRYVDLNERGSELYDEAQELPVANPDRVTALRESARLKEEAVDMLRRALLSGLLDEFGQTPRQDLLYLQQNLVVIYAELGECGAAETRLVRALQDSPILPSGAVDALDGARERVAACRAAAPGEGSEVAAGVALQVGEAFLRAAELYDAGRYDEAADEYFRLVVQSPTNEFAPAALYNAALSHEQLERHEQAARLYLHMVDEYPDSPLVPDATFRAAVNSERAGDYETAISAYARLAELAPSTERARNALFAQAELLESVGEQDAAAAQYATFATDCADDERAPLALYRAGLIHQELGRPERMLDAWERLWSDYGDLRSSDAVPVDAIVIDSLHRTAHHYADEVGDVATAEGFYRRIVDEFERRQDREASSVEAAAHARFALLESQAEAWIEAEVPRDDPDEARRLVHERIAEIPGLVSAFNEVIVIGSAEWTVAAYTIVGRIHQASVDDLMALPVPEALASDEVLADSYRREQADQAEQLRTAAADSWRRALEVSQSAGIENEWTVASAELLDRRRDQVDLTEQERAYIDAVLASAGEAHTTDVVADSSGEPAGEGGRVEAGDPEATGVAMGAAPSGEGGGSTGPELVDGAEIPAEGPEVLPIVLMGTGAALVIAGVIYDVSLMDDLDEFEQIDAACSRGPCDYDRGLELEESIYDAKPVIGGLIGAGLVTAGAGLVLWLLADDDEPAALSVSPTWRADGLGAVMSGRY